eukprot:gene1318-540_t
MGSLDCTPLGSPPPLAKIVPCRDPLTESLLGKTSKNVNILTDSLERTSFQGAVTSIVYDEKLNIVHCANGPYVHSFSFSKNNSQWVLVRDPIAVIKYHVHGLKVCGSQLLAYGDTQFAILNHGDVEFERCETSDWIQTAEFLTNKNLTGELMSFGFVLCLAHNYVEGWSSEHGHGFALSYTVRGCLPSLLYSCAVLPLEDHLLIASGTVYQQICIWQAQPHAFATDHEVESVDTAKLSGHRGVIFSLRWFLNGKILLSTSDDRSIRIWSKENIILNENNNLHNLQLPEVDCVDSDAKGWRSRLELTGHKARVWDAILTRRKVVNSNVPRWVVVSVSEDSSCRVWDPATGNCLQEFYGHQGNGIRSIGLVVKNIQVSPENNNNNIINNGVISNENIVLEEAVSVLTGGEDSDVKSWPLDNFNSSGSAVSAQKKSPSDSSDNQNVDVNSETDFTLKFKCPVEGDWVRSVQFLSLDEAYIATHFGYVYNAKISTSQECQKLSKAKVLSHRQVYRSKNDEQFTCMRYCPNSNFVFIGTVSGRVLVLQNNWQSEKQCSRTFEDDLVLLKRLESFGAGFRIHNIFVAKLKKKHSVCFAINHTGEVKCYDYIYTYQFTDIFFKAHFKCTNAKKKNVRLTCATAYQLPNSFSVCFLGDDSGDLFYQILTENMPFEADRIPTLHGKSKKVLGLEICANSQEKDVGKKIYFLDENDISVETQSIADHLLAKTALFEPFVLQYASEEDNYCKKRRVLSGLEFELSLWSCGADGCLNQHSLKVDVINFTVDFKIEQKLKMKTFQQVSDIAKMDKLSNAPNIITGFNETSFVCWDNDQHKEIFRQSCGGSRRPVDFCFENSGRFSFAFCAENVCTVRGIRSNENVSIISAENVSISDINSGENAEKNRTTNDEAFLSQEVTDDVLFSASHGKEVHCSLFLADDLVLTGSEDNKLMVTQIATNISCAEQNNVHSIKNHKADSRGNNLFNSESSMSIGCVSSTNNYNISQIENIEDYSVFKRTRQIQSLDFHPGAIRAVVKVKIAGFDYVFAAGAKSTLSGYFFDKNTSSLKNIFVRNFNKEFDSDVRIMDIDASWSYRKLVIAFVTSTGDLGVLNCNEIRDLDDAKSSKFTIFPVSKKSACLSCKIVDLSEFSPTDSGLGVLVGSTDGTIATFCLQEKIILDTQNAHDTGCNRITSSLLFSPQLGEGQRIVSIGDDQSITVDQTNFKLRHASSIRGLAVHDNYVFTVGWDRVLKIHSISLEKNELKLVKKHYLSVTEPLSVSVRRCEDKYFSDQKLFSNKTTNSINDADFDDAVGEGELLRICVTGRGVEWLEFRVNKI